MKAEDKLVRFMRAKARKLRTLGIRESLYWTKADERALRKMVRHKKNRKAVWSSIIAAIGFGAKALASSVCPFCRVFFYSDCCEKCPYSQHHGICRKEDSDFGEIQKKLPDAKRAEAFSNAWYKALIKRIEKHDKR